MMRFHEDRVGFAEALADLRSQLASRLQPVLRPEDWTAFDLDRAFRLVTAVAAKLS